MAEPERDLVRFVGRVVHAREVADVVTFSAFPRSIAITGGAVAVGCGVPGGLLLTAVRAPGPP
ncbi:hypothetical protein AB0H42_18210 [Nocardia sp. NPDC050799]|uniref:hypothetical protein n=1 Tax=Nocardia sp. NPDC050799 TaxID=3154842 RepID=UPI00340F81DA